MAAINEYYRPPISAALRIDPGKVLLIVNSDNPLSAQVADYYQSVRGLGNHRLSLPLGASTISSAARYQDIVVPVADYVAAHGIEAVICSAGVPARFNDGNSSSGFNAGSPYGVSTDAMLGAARYWQLLGGLGAANYGLDMRDVVGLQHDPALNSIGASYSTWHAGGEATPGATPVTPDGSGYDVAMQFDSYGVKNNPLIVPWGRIGFPAYDGAPAETYSDTVRMIDDCLWAEAQPAGARDYFAMIADYSGNGRHQWQWYAWQMLLAAGHTCTYAHETNTGINATESAWFGKAHDIDWIAFKAGTAPVAADCYLGSIIRNLPVGDAYANSLVPKRGAWAFNWTSNGNRFVANLLQKGGAAGIGPAMEPYNVGMPDDGSVIAAALRGYSLAEINWLISPASWAMTAWGDPLYRPFPAHGLGDGEFLTVTDATPLKTAGINEIDRAATLSQHPHTLADITPPREATWHA